MNHPDESTVTRTEHRVVQGRPVEVGLDPDELSVRWRPRRPVYLGVRVGDRIKDADSDVTSPRIDEWEVTEITPDRVVGVDVRTGESRAWDRRGLETGLIVGRYATSLAAFATVTVHRVGSWTDDGGPTPTPTPTPTPAVGDRREPYLTVVVYGDNGRTYGRRYRFVEPGNDRDVAPRDEDAAVARLDGDLRARLDEVVRAALVDDGYVVREPTAGADADTDTDRGRRDGGSEDDTGGRGRRSSADA